MRKKLSPREGNRYFISCGQSRSSSSKILFLGFFSLHLILGDVSVHTPLQQGFWPVAGMGCASVSRDLLNLLLNSLAWARLPAFSLWRQRRLCLPWAFSSSVGCPCLSRSLSKFSDLQWTSTQKGRGSRGERWAEKSQSRVSWGQLVTLWDILEQCKYCIWTGTNRYREF